MTDLLSSASASITLADALEVFKGALAGRSERTMALYESSVIEFCAWLQGRGVEKIAQIAPVDLMDYRAEWQEQLDAGRYRPATVAGRLVAVRRFLLRCVAEGFAAPSLSRERIETYLTSPSNPRHARLPVYLEIGEIAQLLGAITNARDRAMFTLALGSGLRVTELVNLRLGDLQPQPDGAAILQVREGKGRKARSFKIPLEVFRPVRAYVESTDRSWQSRADLERPLFAGRDQAAGLSRIRVYQLLTGYTRTAGLSKPVSPHTLRHTFATHYIAAGGNPVALAEILGHSGLEYVMTYAHLARMISAETYAATWLPTES